MEALPGRKDGCAREGAGSALSAYLLHYPISGWLGTNLGFIPSQMGQLLSP